MNISDRKYVLAAKDIIKLAIPVFFAQAAQTAVGFVDAIMLGRVSIVDMSAIVVGLSVWLPAILFGHGLLLALVPIIAQLNGSGRRSLISHQVNHAYWLAALLSIIIMLILWHADYIIYNRPNIDRLLAEKSVDYLRAMAFAVPGYLFYQVERNRCEGLSKTKPGMIIGFIGLLVHIPINATLIYGYFSLPAMGAMGCGITTAIVYWIMFIVIKTWVNRARSLRDVMAFSHFSLPDKSNLWRMINLGLPIALALFFEVTLFSVIALLIFPLGVISLAGHQIAFNFSTLLFVLPLSLGAATTICVGYYLGKKDTKQAMISAWVAQGVGLLITLLIVISTIFCRYLIVKMYTDDPEVIALAAHLLLLAAVYQFSDSIQVIGSGILRGYKDTRAIFFITFTAYWLLGLPSGYLLALTDWILPPMGVAGFWYGIIIGLTFSAIMMVSRVCYIQHLPEQEILRRTAH